MKKMKMYRGQSTHLLLGEERKFSWWQSQFFMFVLFAGVAALICWATVSGMGIPSAHYSMSKQKIVAVYTADGKSLPLNPLPERYERVYIK